MVYSPEFQVFDGSEDREAIMRQTHQTALLTELRYAVQKGDEVNEREIREEFERVFGVTPEQAKRGDAPKVERAVAPPAEKAVPDQASPRTSQPARKATAKAIREGRA